MTAPFKSQRGFTLLEMAFAVLILGLLSVAISPSLRTLLTVRQVANDYSQAGINQRIAAALLSHSEASAVPPGTLSAPCNSSANKVFSAVYDPARCTGTSTLTSYLLQQGVQLNTATTDGSGNKNVRVYQRVANISQDAFLYYQAGPRVYLNYDVGVVYLTNCGFDQPCNQTATSSSPPKSQPAYDNETAATAGAVRLTTANQSTWVPGTRDIGVTYVSTLPLQKKLLQTTADSMERIRTALQNYFTAKQAANPAAPDNWYPRPSNLSQQLPADPDPATNQGCREGWYALDGSLTDVLSQVGIGGGAEFGRTAWGASIEYCRDYDPTLTSGYGVAPHYAALRINRYVSLALNPDSLRSGGDDANNIVVSF